MVFTECYIITVCEYYRTITINSSGTKGTVQHAFITITKKFSFTVKILPHIELPYESKLFIKNNRYE